MEGSKEKQVGGNMEKEGEGIKEKQVDGSKAGREEGRSLDVRRSAVEAYRLQMTVFVEVLLGREHGGTLGEGDVREEL